MRALAAILALTALAGCAEVQTYGKMAETYRIQMNDLQREATVAALCDVSVGSYYRAPRRDQTAIMAACSDDMTPIQAAEP